VSILLFLNELSCGTPQSPDRVDELMEDLVALLRYVKQRRSGASLISPVKREDLELARGYYVSQWIGARPRNRDVWRLIQGMQNRAPYSAVLPPGAAEGADYRVNGTEARGLGAAHLMDGLLVSLLVHPTWDTSWVPATRDELDDEGGGVLTGPVTVRHAATTDHAATHDAWMRRGSLSGFRTGGEIWDARADLYPHLDFLPRVEADLTVLIPAWVAPVAVRLASLNDAAGEWDPTVAGEPSWRSKVTPESVSRKGHCWFDDLDRERRLFDLHARFTPGAGRIHMRLVAQTRSVRIAYIGRKLGT
jgi:hypothetical protein